MDPVSFDNATRPCNGHLLTLELDQLLLTSIPWLAFQHRQLELGCSIVRVDNETQTLRLQSLSCQQVLSNEGLELSCPSCHAAANSGVVHRLTSKASLPWDPHTAFDWLIPHQSKEALERKSEDLTLMRTEVGRLNNLNTVFESNEMVFRHPIAFGSLPV